MELSDGHVYLHVTSQSFDLTLTAMKKYLYIKLEWIIDVRSILLFALSINKTDLLSAVNGINR